MNKNPTLTLVFLCLCIFGFAQSGFSIDQIFKPYPSFPLRSPIPNTVAQKSPGVYYLPLGSGVHEVYVDLLNVPQPPLVTPLKDKLLLATTVTDFSSEYDCLVAINGSWFGPYESQLQNPYVEWNRYNQPSSGATLWSAGPATTRGELYPSTAYKNITDKSGTLSFTSGNVASITSPAMVPKNAYTALSGNMMLVENGQSVADLNDTDLQPRTTVGLDQSGTVLIIMVVDGRQPLLGFNGITYYQLSQRLIRAGAYTALAFDGGGSTTLVINNKVVNSPSVFSNGFFPQLRPVGPSLGFCP